MFRRNLRPFFPANVAWDSLDVRPMLLGNCSTDRWYKKWNFLAQTHNVMFGGKRTLICWVMQQKRMTQSTKVNPLKNGWKRSFVFWNGQVRVLTLNLIKMLWHSLERALQSRHPKTGGRNGSKFILNVVQILSEATWNIWWGDCCYRGIYRLLNAGFTCFFFLHCGCVLHVFNDIHEQYSCLCIICLFS